MKITGNLAKNSWCFLWQRERDIYIHIYINIYIISVGDEVPIKVRVAIFCGAAEVPAAAGRPRLALGRVSSKSSGELSRSAWSLPALVLSWFSVL